MKFFYWKNNLSLRTYFIICLNKHLSTLINLQIKIEEIRRWIKSLNIESYLASLSDKNVSLHNSQVIQTKLYESSQFHIDLTHYTLLGHF